jgi:regulator of sirC expression with transglutaminase-like and TPR domain
MVTHPARKRLQTLLASPDSERLNLAEAALCIAWEDRGEGDPESALFRLDVIAAGARSRLPSAAHPPTILAALNSYLFDDLGFRGNTWNYSDPQNSYLDQVLESRVGLPITLSLIYLEVGWRLQLPLAGVALPGHFIVRYVNASDIESSVFIDPFHRGRRWSYSECEEQVRRFYGTVTPDIIRSALAPPDPRDVLSRMLRNLKGVYIDRNDLARALAAVERILLIEGELPLELRDRGLIRSRLGMYNLALEDLDTYARLMPEARDLDVIRRHALGVAEKLGRRS